MKFKISLLVLGIVLNNIRSSTSEYSPATNLRFTPEAVIHQLSEQIRFLIRSGDINNGIPVLDPYEFQWKQLNLEGGQMFSIEIHNTSLWGKIYLKQSDDGKSILLDKIEEPEFSIERIESRTQFDNNIDGLISSMVEELLADYLTRFNKYIAQAYIDKIVGYLNPTLDKFDNWNIIAVLLSDNQDNGGNDN
ncbi:hypothetical protein B5X24_HaOG201362 [Helicoverpa armigera]|nr:hypothetical protein B5X24_HaOG201362 [Helicoverpa armigera]